MKLLVCDIEGTIFNAKIKVDGVDYSSTLWQPIAISLGKEVIKEESEMAARYDNGGYDSYIAWVKATIEMHIKYSLKKDVFDDLVDRAEYNEGVEDFFNHLDRNEWIPVFISGGFQNLVRRAENELGAEYGFGACEYYFDKYGSLEHFNIQPCDFDGKIKFLRTILSEMNLNEKTDWVFIGDGKNDVHIAKRAPKAFCINPHSELKAVEGITEINSFMDLLPYLDDFNQNNNECNPTTAKSKRKLYISPGSDDITILKYNVLELKKKLTQCQQQYNDLKCRIESKANDVTIIPITVNDYRKTPLKELSELTRGLNIIFIGLNDYYESCRRIKERKVPKKELCKYIFN